MPKVYVTTATRAIAERLIPPRSLPNDFRATRRCPFCGKTLNALCVVGTEGIMPIVTGWETCDCQESKADALERAARQAREEQERKAALKAELMRKRIDRAFKESGMPERWRGYTFERFKAEEGSTNAYARCKRYAEWIADCEKKHSPTPPPNGIYLSGRSGNGKTHLAAAILNAIIAASPSTPTLAMSMQELIGRLKQSYDSDESEAKEDELIKTYTEVPVLLIDDLGSEQPTEWAADRIFRIVNGRYNNNLPTIVTSNYDTDSLAKRLTPKRHSENGDYTDGIKIADRLAEMCVEFKLTGESYRRKRAKEG